MTNLLKYGLIGFIILSSQLSWADSASIEPEAITYFRDSSTSMTFEEILDPSINWQVTTHTNFGFTHDALWLRLTLYNASINSTKKFLRINYPLLDHVDAYLLYQGQLIEHKYLSDRIPYNEQRLNDKYYLFQYTLAPKSHYQVYLRIESQSSMTVPIELYQEAEYVKQKTYENYWFGALYGSLIIMGLYNLVLAITLRSLVYFLYVGYLSGLTFLISALNGDGFQFLWPNHPNFNNLTPLIGGVWPSLFTLPLAYHFLQIKHYAPRLAKFYRALYLLVILSIVSLFFLDYQDSSKLLNIMNLIFSPVILITALNFAWHNRPGAAAFALAWLALVISLTILSLSIYNIIPSNAYTRQAYSFAGLLELVIISLALARQINQFIEEKNIALRASKIHLSKYQDIFHNSPAGIFTANIDGHMINYNSAFARIMKLEHYEPSRLNIFNDITKDPIDIKKMITYLERGQVIESLPLLCQTGNNDERWLALTLSLQGENENRTLEGHITDIHHRVSKQQEKEQLDRQRMESLRLLIAGIAHEINTPLGNNLTTLSFIDDIYNELKHSSNDNQIDALANLNTSFELLKRNEHRISLLVKRFTMVSIGYLQASPVIINGDEMLTKIALYHQDHSSGVKIHTYYQGPKTFISYEDSLRVIIESLIDNSIKHGFSANEGSRKGCKIEIELLVNDDDRCEINYHDNGKGIDEEIKDKVFQPFFTTSRGNEETSGLGLYAIDNIVNNLFQGKLSIQNQDKPGFHLHIELPLLNEQDSI